MPLTYRGYEYDFEPTGPFTSVDQIEAANKAKGDYWFDPASHEFFETIVYKDTLIAGRYFITSERAALNEARNFTVRAAHDNGTVETVGSFQGYSTKENAIAAALRHAQDIDQ